MVPDNNMWNYNFVGAGKIINFYNNFFYKGLVPTMKYSL